MRLTALAIASIILACASPGRDAPDTSASSAAGEASRDTSSRPPGAASSPVELRVDQSEYAPGAAMTLTLVNTTADTFAFNPCTRHLEREAGTGWARIEEDRVCTMEAWMLEPRATRSGDTELPSSLQPGRYRVTLSLSRQGPPPPGDNELAISSPFSVVR